MRGTDFLSTGRTTTPIPRRDIEKEKDYGNGPVQYGKLSDEELAEVKRKYGEPIQPLPKRPNKVWTEPGNGLGVQQKSTRR